MKRVTLILGAVGVLIYVLGVGMIASQLPRSSDYTWTRCLSDWDPIDGYRFDVSDVAWAMDGGSFRLTVTKNAYWPCSHSEIYVVNADGTEPRILENQDSIEWDRALAPSQNTSPSGDKSISWSHGFWMSNEFGLAVLDLKSDQEIKVDMDNLMEDLEQRAKKVCMPKECMNTTISGLFEPGWAIWGFMIVMPIGLTFMVPALWMRRQRILTKLALIVVVIHLGFNVVILLNVLFRLLKFP